MRRTPVLFLPFVIPLICDPMLPLVRAGAAGARACLAARTAAANACASGGCGAGCAVACGRRAAAGGATTAAAAAAAARWSAQQQVRGRWKTAWFMKGAGQSSKQRLPCGNG